MQTLRDFGKPTKASTLERNSSGQRQILPLRSEAIPVCDAESCYLAAVGMAGDSADASLLTSAIEEDSTESPNIECPERSEIHPRYDIPVQDAPRKRRNDSRNGALLSDFDDIIDYIDCCSLTQIWLSRIYSKFFTSRIFFISSKNTLYTFVHIIRLIDVGNDNKR